MDFSIATPSEESKSPLATSSHSSRKSASECSKLTSPPHRDGNSAAEVDGDNVFCSPKFLGDGTLLLIYSNGTDDTPYAVRFRSDTSYVFNASALWNTKPSNTSFTLNDFQNQSAAYHIAGDKVYDVSTGRLLSLLASEDNTSLSQYVISTELRRVYVISQGTSKVVSFPFVDKEGEGNITAEGQPLSTKYRLPIPPQWLSPGDVLVHQAQRLVYIPTTKGGEILRMEPFGLYRIPDAAPGLGDAAQSLWVPSVFSAGSTSGVFNYSSHQAVLVLPPRLRRLSDPLNLGHPQDSHPHSVSAMVVVWVTVAFMALIVGLGMGFLFLILRKFDVQKRLRKTFGVGQGNLPGGSVRKTVTETGQEMDDTEKLRLNGEIEKLVMALGKERQSGQTNA